MNYPCGKFGDCSFSCFAFIVQIIKHIDTQMPLNALSPVHAKRVALRRVDATTFGLLASNVCIFIQLSITSFSVMSLSMTSLAQVLSGGV